MTRKSGRRKTLLLFPPLWVSEEFETDFPTLGIPSLVGALRASGIPVRHLDLNAGFFRYLLGCVRTRRLHPGAREEEERVKRLLLRDLAQDWLAFWNERLRPPLMPEISRLAFNDFIESRYEGIAPFLADRRNPYLRFFREDAKLRDAMADLGDGIVGISILGPSQALPALTLAALVRERAPSSRIVLGGPWVALFHEPLARSRDLGKYFDALVSGEGESTLRLLCALPGDPDGWKGIPNLHFRKEGILVAPSLIRVEELNDLPAPDFTDLDPEDYAFPRTFTYQTSRGCYWGRCAFCEHVYGCHRKGYREKELSLVLRDLRLLNLREGAKRIVFTDAAISPKRLRELSRGLLHRKLKFNWWCFCRPESEFRPEDFRLAREAGCECIDFGLETANPRMARLMQRGAALSHAGRIFKACANAGIDLLVGAIIRFPTETEDEALDTFRFLETHREFIRKPMVNLFNLRRGTPIHQAPGRYGLTVQEDPGEAFRANLRYLSDQPLTAARAMELLHDFLDSGKDGIRGPEHASAPRDAGSRFHCGEYSIYRFALRMPPDPAPEGVHVFVRRGNGEDAGVFRIRAGDPAMIRLFRKPIGFGEAVRKASRAFDLSMPDADLLMRHQVDNYLKAGIIGYRKEENHDA